MKTNQKIYEVFMAVLAIISIILIVLSYGSVIDINHGYPELLNNAILIIFTIDYFTRLFLAKDKKKFFKENIFDLLSIIPVSASFNLFRFDRIGRLVVVFRLVRLIGLTGKLNRLLKINGLIYIIYTSIAILIVSASMYSISERVPYGESLWWAIATATTIGYGDISPHTFLGKLAAILLMVIGIGFVGVLTSSLTNFFIQDHTNDRMATVLNKLSDLEKSNRELQAEVRKLLEEERNK
ncbi:potassium channel family protein [Limosilactobacillus panis]|uniref:potassium channel family protein n=1 Tax=Limosilactobacillus panis TaxID=47493 RepID=UPI001C988E41|nr:potassium channel family protein [Limosilactobacillus panis]QZN92535.1 potassium channel family protein [Limosilactobacillus panis]